MIHRTTQEARRGQPHGSRVERLAVGERLRPTSGNAGPSATSQSRGAIRKGRCIARLRGPLLSLSAHVAGVHGEGGT